MICGGVVEKLESGTIPELLDVGTGRVSNAIPAVGFTAAAAMQCWAGFTR